MGVVQTPIGNQSGRGTRNHVGHFSENWEQTRYFNMSNDGNAFELGVNMDTEVAMVAVGTGKKRYNDD